MDFNEIKKLIELVENASISHLSLDENGTKIEIKKEFAQTTSVVLPQHAPIASPAQAPIAVPKTSVENKIEEEDDNTVNITAQMVGTYYNSPSPDAPPFVKVGDKIEKGKVICIIEAMKLFNEIESDISGIVKEICVNNEQAVEFGQILFKLHKE